MGDDTKRTIAFLVGWVLGSALVYAIAIIFIWPN